MIAVISVMTGKDTVTTYFNDSELKNEKVEDNFDEDNYPVSYFDELLGC